MLQRPTKPDAHPPDSAARAHTPIVPSIVEVRSHSGPIGRRDYDSEDRRDLTLAKKFSIYRDRLRPQGFEPWSLECPYQGLIH